MFDVSFPELILIAIVGLLVIGPKRLPEALRTLGLWIGRMRRSFTNVKAEIEKEIGMDEIRRQLHNEAVMEEMKRIERDVRHSVHAGESGASNRAGTKSQGRAPAPRPEPAPGSRQVPAAPRSSDDANAAPSTPAPSGEHQERHVPEPPSGAEQSSGTEPPRGTETQRGAEPPHGAEPPPGTEPRDSGRGPDGVH